VFSVLTLWETENPDCDSIPSLLFSITGPLMEGLEERGRVGSKCPSTISCPASRLPLFPKRKRTKTLRNKAGLSLLAKSLERMSLKRGFCGSSPYPHPPLFFSGNVGRSLWI
jgi:hypothetical protein